VEVSAAPGIPKSVVAPAATVVAGLLWLVLALRNPTNTFHFAPIIVAAAWPVIARGSQTRTRIQALTAVSAGTAIALGIGLTLWANDRLRGPTLWHSGAAITETLLFTLLGGAIGLIAQLRHSPEHA
jgi:hypothetical protein